MAVYVDDMAASFTPTHVQGRRYVMCHMMADTDEELMAMADKIGVNRKWIQRVRSGTHFDIAKSKKAQAIKLGAVEITAKEMAAYAWHRRTFGFNAVPSVALEKMKLAISARKRTDIEGGE